MLIDVVKDGVISLTLAKWTGEKGEDDMEGDGEEDGEENVEEVTLESAHNHPSNESKEMVREIKKEMIMYQKENPEILPDACRRKIMLRYESMYVPEKVLEWEDIIADLGEKTSTQRIIRIHRAAATGKRVLNRDDFDYQSFLEAVPGGEKVKTIDSNNPSHLPKN